MSGAKTTPLKVEGMMCQKNCASTVQKALLGVGGVERAEVSFAKSSAIVHHAGSVSSKQLLDAIESVGFDVTLLENTEPLFRLDVQGMMCQKNCASTVQNAIMGVDNVSWATVSFQQKEAKVFGIDVGSDVLLRSIISSIEAVGFDAKMKTYKGKFCSSVPAAREGASAPVPLISAAAGTNSKKSIDAVASKSKQESFPKGSDSIREVELQVGGMSCASCVRAVENGLTSMEGVKSVRVALLAEKVLALMDSDVIGSSDVVSRIISLGYTAKVLAEKSLSEISTRKFVFEVSGMSCASCATKIEQTLSGLKGVSDALVSIATNMAEVEVDDVLADSVGPRDLISAVEALGYGCKLADRVGRNGDTPSEDLLVWGRLLFISLLLGVPVMILHMSMSHFDSVMMMMKKPALCHGGITLGQTLMVALNLPLQFGVGYRFYRGAVLGALHGNFGMDCLVVTGTTISFAYSSVQLFFACATHIPTTHVFFEASGMLLMFVTLGKFMEAFARGKSASAITDLLKLQPTHALLVTGDGEPLSPRANPPNADLEHLKHDSYGTLKSDHTESRMVSSEKIVEIDVELVQRGDLLKVLPGARIPTDGTIVFGSSYVDESMITGESVAMLRTKGDLVFGSTVNHSGLIYIRVSSIGSESALAQIVRLVENAQMSKAPVQKYADTIAGIFTPIVLTLALLTFVVWASLAWAHLIPREWFADEYGDPMLFSMLFGISVIVISCPCALGLATPTAIMVGTSVGAMNGILIKGGPAFEMAHSIDTIVFDKTGTLTTGKPVVTDILCDSQGLTVSNGLITKQKEQIVLLAATAEQGSEHPLASALLDAAKGLGMPLPRLQENAFERFDGMGIACKTSDGLVRVGNRLFMIENKIPLSSTLEEMMITLEHQGKTALCIALDAKILGAVGIADAPKAESQATVRALREMGMDIWMVTGDNHTTAEAIAKEIGIPLDRVLAGAMPADKVTKVEELKKKGRSVAVVGDGINDSPALARADLGIAIGAGTQVAVEAADMVLVRSNLFDVVVALDLAKVVFNRIRLNFLWAIMYNVVAIPFAAGIWFPWTHMLVPPQYAGLCMALSSISVVLSSALLRCYRRPLMIEGNKGRVSIVESGKR